MTLDQLVEAGARAIAPRCWEVMDAYLEQTKRKYAGQHVGWPADQFKDKESMAQFQAALLAILPLLADDLAGVIQRRMDERFAEYGTTESDTNASYYSGRAGELYESLDEEDEEIAQAIRTRLTALENENDRS